MDVVLILKWMKFTAEVDYLAEMEVHQEELSVICWKLEITPYDYK